jgi:caspase domain-containing protein/trypsin-like peptidase
MSETPTHRGEVLRRYQTALVRVEVEGRNIENRPEKRLGTGVVVGANGWIITAKHVVGDDTEWAETAPGTRKRDRTIKVTGRNEHGIPYLIGMASVQLIPELDLALLRVTAQNLQAVPRADEQPPDHSRVVVLLWTPGSVPDPVVADLDPTDTSLFAGPTVRVPVVEGNSGSGLFDDQFRLTGIIVRKKDDHSALAIPIAWAKPAIDPFIGRNPQVTGVADPDRASSANSSPPAVLITPIIGQDVPPPPDVVAPGPVIPIEPPRSPPLIAGMIGQVEPQPSGVLEPDPVISINTTQPFSQPPPITPLSSPNPPRPPFALVIGITKYPPHFDADDKPLPEQQFTPLQGAANDAIELKKFLSEQAYSVDEPLIDEKATLAGIMNALDELRNKCKAPGVSNPTVLIYFSGHGACDVHGRSYLVPYDARRDRLFSTALWSNTLDAALNELGANRTIVFLDACHAEAIGTADGKDGESKSLPFDLNSIVPATTSGRFLVASCMAGEKSYEDAKARHGIFTGHLLELLRCKDPDALPEEIELWDLYGVLKTRVLQTGANQEPFASFRGSTGVVVAVNEPLRKLRLQRKLRYLPVLGALILPSVRGQARRIAHARPIAIIDMLKVYCSPRHLMRPGFGAFYQYFDECAGNMDPEVSATIERRLDKFDEMGPEVSANFEWECQRLLDTFDELDPKVIETFEWECRRLLDTFDELEPGASSRIPRVQAVAGPRSAGAGPSAAAAVAPRANEAAEGRRLEDMPANPAKPPAPGFADEPELPALSGQTPRKLDDADVEYVLEVLSTMIASREGQDFGELLRKSQELRELLVRTEGTTLHAVTNWLSRPTPRAVSHQQWVAICESINQRFKERAKEMPRMSPLDARVLGASREVPRQ